MFDILNNVYIFKNNVTYKMFAKKVFQIQIINL